MRIQALSDLHTEFGPRIWPRVDADVVLLAGDIGKGLQGLEYARTTFPDRPVLYVAGNHEYYGHAMPALTGELRAAAEGTHVHMLEDDEIVLDGVRFVGCTLWTDFRLMGADQRHLAEIEASARLNDYRRIEHNGHDIRRLRPRDTVDAHARSRNWLAARLSEPFPGPTVVMTHHAPSIRSLDPARTPNMLDAAFASDLESLMDGDRVRLWVHGHTHRCVDYTINGTRILSNAAGYPGDPAPGFDPALVINVIHV